MSFFSISLTSRRHNFCSFPLAAFLLFGICLTFYVSVLTYYTVGSSIMQHSGHHWASDSATNFLAIPNLMSIFFSPFFGSIVDRKGSICVRFALSGVHT